MEEHFEIYEKISLLFNIKFKSQITNLDIQFESIYYIKNIINTDEYYFLVFQNEQHIKFHNKLEFLKNFSQLIVDEIEALEFESKELNKQQNQRFKFDQNQIFLEHERIGHNIFKLQKLLKKIYSFLGSP